MASEKKLPAIEGQLGMKVLILETSRLFQKTLKELLEEVGCSVDCATDCDQALKMRQAEEYRLMIAGQNVFDEPSQEFIDYCRHHSQKTPVTLLTSEPNERLLSNAREAGITDIFPKTNIELLRESIHYYIRGKKEISIQGGKVIYVEDSPSVAAAIVRDLRKLKLEVKHFLHAEDAFKALTSGNQVYDMLITDIMLSGNMSGLALVRLVRAHSSEISELPILAMTGHDEPGLRIALFHAGINDYVTKPPVIQELAARVDNLITNKRLFDQVQEQKVALQKIAMQDQLTGCHNRHSLAENAPKYIYNAIRYKYPLSLVICDLDFFKEVNDRYGHDVGDRVLSEVGALLVDSCRQGDFVARIGGEEFLILLPHCNSIEALRKAETLRARIQKKSPGGVNVTASLGIASLDNMKFGDFDRLYKAADEAVYESKEHGRNRVTLSTSSTNKKSAQKKTASS